MIMQNSIIIEGVTRQEFFDAIAGVMEGVQTRLSKREYSINELSGMTGYSPAHLRKIIKDNDIPYRKTGRGLSVPFESLHRIPQKTGHPYIALTPPGLIPS